MRVKEGVATFLVGQLCEDMKARANRVFPAHLLRRAYAKRLRELLAFHASNVNVRFDFLAYVLCGRLLSKLLL